MRQQQNWFACDRCEAASPPETFASDARESARKGGWLLTPGSADDVCPECRKGAGGAGMSGPGLVGKCPVCGGRYRVTMAGEMRTHGKPANRCPGSGSDPEPSILVYPHPHGTGWPPAAKIASR
jgi:hypothetical protein